MFNKLRGRLGQALGAPGETARQGQGQYRWRYRAKQPSPANWNSKLVKSSLFGSHVASMAMSNRDLPTLPAVLRSHAPHKQRPIVHGPPPMRSPTTAPPAKMIYTFQYIIFTASDCDSRCLRPRTYPIRTPCVYSVSAQSRCSLARLASPHKLHTRRATAGRTCIARALVRALAGSTHWFSAARWHDIGRALRAHLHFYMSLGLSFSFVSCFRCDWLRRAGALRALAWRRANPRRVRVIAVGPARANYESLPIANPQTSCKNLRCSQKN